MYVCEALQVGMLFKKIKTLGLKLCGGDANRNTFLFEGLFCVWVRWGLRGCANGTSLK